VRILEAIQGVGKFDVRTDARTVMPTCVGMTMGTSAEGSAFPTPGTIAQLRTTDLAGSIAFCTNTAWGTREFAVKDDRGHVLCFGTSR
jgi:hypothetical protein